MEHEGQQSISSESCADLERLATAAATLGYSDSMSLHHTGGRVVNNNNNNNNVSSNVTNNNHHQPSTTVEIISNNPIVTDNGVPTGVTHYAEDPYALSRTQSCPTVRIVDYTSSNGFDNNQIGHITEHDNPQIITQTYSTVLSPKLPNQYTVVERPNSYIYAPLKHATHYITPTPEMPSTTGPLPTTLMQTVHHTDDNSLTVAGNSYTGIVSQSTVIESSCNTMSENQQVLHFLDERLVPTNHQEEVVVANESLVIKKRIKRNEVPPKFYKQETSNFAKPEFTNNSSDLQKIPEPVVIYGKKFFVCPYPECEEKFARKYLFKRHQITHTGEKRGALTIETKVEIIKRIQGGEKQVNLAMEYNVGRSTLSFIMKNAEKFLSVLKYGKFHPDSKRLRGAQREDVEDALVEWLKQAEDMGLPISGSILCQKAKNFAEKLGYKDFKATHGWLDRFKHRKNIMFSRGKGQKAKEMNDTIEEFKEYFNSHVLPVTLVDYEANDVFHADETALFYRILPEKCLDYKGNKCGGGSYSKKRIIVLMCTNMTGSEKFPLLVIGKYSKPKCFVNVKSLPVQYLSNSKAWMTSESYTAWLQDLDSWFVQQNRRILLVIPSLMVYPKCPKLIAVKVLQSPPSFIGPCKLGITNALKKNYRRAILEMMLQHVEGEGKKGKKKAKKTFKLNILTCLHTLAAAWHAVTDVTINNNFQKSGMGKYGFGTMNLAPESYFGTENLNLIHVLKLKCKGYKIPENLTFDDYLTFDDSVQVCHMMDDDDIIAMVIKTEVESTDSEDGEWDEHSNGANIPLEEGVVMGPPLSSVMSGLDIIKQHIESQDNSYEMIRVLNHLHQLINKGLLPQTETMETGESSTMRSPQ